MAHDLDSLPRLRLAACGHFVHEDAEPVGKAISAGGGWNPVYHCDECAGKVREHTKRVEGEQEEEGKRREAEEREGLEVEAREHRRLAEEGARRESEVSEQEPQSEQAAEEPEPVQPLDGSERGQAHEEGAEHEVKHRKR